MPLDTDFLALLTHEASWRKKTGEDSFGNPVYAAAVTVECFPSSDTEGIAPPPSQDRRRTQARRETSLIVDALGFAQGDKITFDGDTMFVVAVETYHDETESAAQTVVIATEEDA